MLTNRERSMRLLMKERAVIRRAKQKEIREILHQICNCTGYKYRQLINNNRKKPLPEKRMMCMLYLDSRGYTSIDIGKVMGRDHSTVLSGISKISDLINIYPGVKTDYFGILEYLKDNTIEELSQPVINHK